MARRLAAAGLTATDLKSLGANPAVVATVLRFPYAARRPWPAYGNAATGIRYTGSRALFALVVSAVFHIVVLAAIAAATGERARWTSTTRTPIVVQVELASAPSPSRAIPVQQAPFRPGAGVQRAAVGARRVLSEVRPNPPVVAAATPEPIAVATAETGNAEFQRPGENTAAPGASAQGPVPATMSMEIPAPRSTPASYNHSPKPEYPLAAREDGQEGVVVLRVHVSSQGLPTEVRIDRSSGFALLDRAALSAVRYWTFAPATSGGRHIESWMEVPIRFRLSDP